MGLLWAFRALRGLRRVEVSVSVLHDRFPEEVDVWFWALGALYQSCRRCGCRLWGLGCYNALGIRGFVQFIGITRVFSLRL